MLGIGTPPLTLVARLREDAMNGMAVAMPLVAVPRKRSQRPTSAQSSNNALAQTHRPPTLRPAMKTHRPVVRKPASEATAGIEPAIRVLQILRRISQLGAK